MTIENLKQIAIKYASTKGSRIPLAPDELCNAVVQYMNSFFGVMTDINTIKVAVTEDSGNIVFTITGNTYDGKPITPIVITVDHNDFVTDQEFEEFKTTTNAAIQKNTESINSLSFRVEDTENDITTIQVQVGQINTRVGNTETNITNLKNRVGNTETNITNLKNRVDNTETNIAEINSTLDNKVDVIKNPASNFVAYVHINQKDENVSFTESAVGNTIVYRRASDGGFNVSKGTSGQNVANMENIADVEAKIPDVSNFATKDEIPDVSGFATKSELSNKRSVISSPASNYVVYTQANGLESNLPYSELANQTSTNIMARRANGTSDVKKGISGENVANMENIADVEAKIPDVSNFATKDEIPDVSGFATKSELSNKRSVISSPASNYVVYTQANGLESNLPYSELANQTSTNIMARRANGTSDVKKGISGENVANMQNIADVEAKIPSTDNFLLKNVVNIINYSKFKIIDEVGNNIIGKDDASNTMYIGSADYPMQLNSRIRPIIRTPGFTYELAYINDIPAYKNVYSVSYDTTNGAIVAYDGANEIHIPLLAGENVTIDASEDNKKIVISAAGGGGTGDVTTAGNNIFTGENEFRNYTYVTSDFCFVDTKEDYLTNGYTTTIKNGGFNISYYENGESKYWTTYADNQIINKDIDMEGEVVIKLPKKAGTFALTSDIIKDPIYFISFYANAPSEPCHLIGTMMSKNSYGTGQKTNEEFAVMLTDNLYTNSNEGLAAYGKLAKKDILCIYSEDGLSIRCLDEEDSEVDLPTVMFFVMETEL